MDGTAQADTVLACQTGKLQYVLIGFTLLCDKLQFAEMLSQTDMPITIYRPERNRNLPASLEAGRIFYSILRMLDLGTAPMDWLTILPFLMTSRVGMLLMPYLAASCGS